MPNALERKRQNLTPRSWSMPPSNHEPALGGAFNLLASNEHNHIFEVQTGVLAEESRELIQAFLKAAASEWLVFKVSDVKSL